MFGSKLTRANQREGDGKGAGLGRKQVVEGRGRFGCQGPFLGSSVKVSDGFRLSLSMCKRGLHDLLKVRSSSLLM